MRGRGKDGGTRAKWNRRGQPVHIFLPRAAPTQTCFYYLFIAAASRSGRGGADETAGSESSSSDAASAASRQRRQAPTAGRPSALPGRLHAALGLLVRSHVAARNLRKVSANVTPLPPTVAWRALKGVRRILVRGSMPPCLLRRRKF